jgi:hypothetical protein
MLLPRRRVTAPHRLRRDKGAVFGRLYRRTQTDRRTISAGDIRSKRCRGADSRFAVHAAGDGALRYLATLRERISLLNFHDDLLPSGRAACAIARRIFASAAADFNDYNAVLPHYARKSDAEVAKEKRVAPPSP